MTMNPQPQLTAPQLPFSQLVNYQSVAPPQLAQIPNHPAVSKKRRASKACVYCNRSHMSCEDARPCKRCIDRGIAHLCKDTDTGKRRGRKGTYLYDYGEQTPSMPDTSPPPVPIPTTTTLPPTYAVTTLHSEPVLQAPVIDLPIDFLSLFSFPDNVPVEQECSAEAQEIQFQKDLEKMLEIIGKRAPEMVQWFKERVYIVKDKITKYYKETRMVDLGKIDHKQMIESTRSESIVWTKKYEQMFENLAIPVFVFDRTSAIRYVNPAYKALSGFNKPLPTEAHHIYVDLFSAEGMRSYMESMFNFLENFPNMLNSTGFMFKSSIRVHDGTNAEKSLEGTMVINFRRDAFDFPYLYLGSFLPAELKRTLTFQPIISNDV